MPAQLPTSRFVVDEVPSEHRKWVEAALTAPLNRVLDPLRSLFARVFVSQMNVQLLEHKGIPPTTTAPASFASKLTGRCAGVVLVGCWLLESGGQEGAAVSGLTSPGWRYVAATDRAAASIQVTAQATLTATTKYLIRWLAIGEG